MGQSRIKRKLVQKPSSSSSTCDNDIDPHEMKTMKTDSFKYESLQKDSKVGRKRSNSLAGSTASTDDSRNSVVDEISAASSSGTSSPATSAHEYSHTAYSEQEDYVHPLLSMKSYELSPKDVEFSSKKHTTEWLDLMALRYISSNGPYHHPALLPPQPYYPPMHQNYESISLTPNYRRNETNFSIPYHGMQYVPHTPENDPSVQSSSGNLKRPTSQPLKKCNFTISAILGCET